LKSVRLSDVARRAGVSTASVSRVLNTPEKVSAELRAQVEAALKELRYVPHGAARALASQRSRTIGAVVPTLGIAIFAKGIEALQARLHADGYTLLIASAAYDLAKELDHTRALIERGVDGIALVGAQHLPALDELLDASGLPHVNTYVYDPKAARPCIGIDNHAASYRLTRHLVELGHRDVALLTSPTRNNDRTAPVSRTTPARCPMPPWPRCRTRSTTDAPGFGPYWRAAILSRRSRAPTTCSPSARSPRRGRRAWPCPRISRSPASTISTSPRTSTRH